jgi:DNA-binding transcriptional MerR regulator
MQIRVEELASRSGVSVDTIRFYQKQRLLPPPRREGRVAWYDEDHLARMERVKELRRRGFTLAVIRRFLEGELDSADEPLAAAVAEAADEPAEEFLTAEELASRSGVPLALIESVAAEGLLVPRLHDGTPHYTTDDIKVVSAGLRLLQAGLPLSALLDLARRHHRATRDVAGRAVSLFDAAVRQPLRSADLPEEEKAQRLVESFRTLLPAVNELVSHHFRRVLLQVAQEHLESVGHPAELSAAEAEALRLVEVTGTGAAGSAAPAEGRRRNSGAAAKRQVKV